MRPVGRALAELSGNSSVHPFLAAEGLGRHAVARDPTRRLGGEDEDVRVVVRGERENERSRPAEVFACEGDRDRDPCASRTSASASALPLDVRQKRALVAFHDRPFQSGDYQDLNRVDRDTAYREMQDLEQRGLLRGDGTTKARRYNVDRSVLPNAPKTTAPLSGLVERMKESGRITNTDVRDALGLSRVDARKLLARWVEEGAVELRGERRGAHYVASSAWPPAYTA